MLLLYYCLFCHRQGWITSILFLFLTRLAFACLLAYCCHVCVCVLAVMGSLLCKGFLPYVRTYGDKATVRICTKQQILSALQTTSRRRTMACMPVCRGSKAVPAQTPAVAYQTLLHATPFFCLIPYNTDSLPYDAVPHTHTPTPRDDASGGSREKKGGVHPDRDIPMAQYAWSRLVYFFVG